MAVCDGEAAKVPLQISRTSYTELGSRVTDIRVSNTVRTCPLPLDEYVLQLPRSGWYR